MVKLIWNRPTPASTGKHPYFPSPEVNLIQNRATASARTTHPLLSSSPSSLPEQLQSPLEQNDTIQETSNTTPDSNTKKCVRGPTRGLALRKLNNQNKCKLAIHIDPIQGRPLDSIESAKLSSELGVLSRELMPVPTKWKKLTDSEKMMAIDQLDLTLSIDNSNEETVENVLALLKHRSRHQRHRLNTHFKKFSTVEEAIQNKPSYGGLTQENWEELCHLFSDPKYQERCRKNKQNRSKMKTNHNQGSRAFVVARRMLTQRRRLEGQQQLDDHEVDRINFYKHSHYTEGKGWITPECEKNYAEMERRVNDGELSGERVDVDEIANDVLGKKSSYIVGLGYGPKPKKDASNSTIKMLQKALSEKEDELLTMKATLEKHSLLLQKLMESQQQSSSSS